MPAEIKITINQQSSGNSVAAAKRDLNDLSDTAKNAGSGFSSLKEVATGALRQVGAIATQAFLEAGRAAIGFFKDSISRSEEHTSELQSQSNLVCRLLLEKK